MRTRKGPWPAGPDFGATPEGLPVLKALRSLPDLMGRKNVGPAQIDTSLLVGSWRRLVLSAPHLEPGTVDWKGYVFCVLESFHRMLRRREVFAKNSSKWGDPRAKLLDGEAWEQVRLSPFVRQHINMPGRYSSSTSPRSGSRKVNGLWTLISLPWSHVSERIR